jgi:hypothetical protein
MSQRLRYAGVTTAIAVLAAAPASAQFEEPRQPPPAVYFGGQPLLALTVGEFSDYVTAGGGLDVYVVYPVRPASPFALRADGGFIVYGSETLPVCFSTTVGCRVQLDVTTTNSIAFLNAGPQLMVPTGRLRPYVNGAVGLAYFGTTSSVRGDDSSQTFASTSNFDDLTLALSAGGGVQVALGSGRTPVLLDIGARYHGNGSVEYLREGDITDNEDGSIALTPRRSQANLVSFQVGVTVGAGRRQR